jgi:hypothetical protein|tara:strand:+ start:195 stop:803 length:609 start_codon:yes stop_codon:yes gene_type:complete
MADITTLQQSLINAKKVMSKVNTGDYTKGNVSLPSEGNVSNISAPITEGIPQNIPSQIPTPQTKTPNLSPKANMSEERIKNSNLPDAIKQAMIDNPIPDIPFNNGTALPDDFLTEVKNKMDKQGIPTSPVQETNTSPIPSPLIKETRTKKISSKNLKSIIKESVKELLDETIGLKTDNDENFQFRVGDRIFYGKITSSKVIK